LRRQQAAAPAAARRRRVAAAAHFVHPLLVDHDAGQVSDGGVGSCREAAGICRVSASWRRHHKLQPLPRHQVRRQHPVDRHPFPAAAAAAAAAPTAAVVGRGCSGYQERLQAEQRGRLLRRRAVGKQEVCRFSSLAGACG
jgi:hypothetical protein